VLRLVLKQSNALPEWKQVEVAGSSALLRVECLRTLDRLRIRTQPGDEEIAGIRSSLFRFLDAIHFIELDQPILDKASQPFPTELGSLDALHLATALLWRESSGFEVVMATHDLALSIAARAEGLRVVGTTLPV
jgi:hypothetical protein